MTIIRINAITVPDQAGPELEKRFAARSAEVDKMPGFEGFELLRPTDGSKRYFVVTRWADIESFDAWVSSQSFASEHAKAAAGDRPVSAHAELLSFEVVDLTV
ncbi:MAG: extracellular polysaccharide biosynthesis protein [Ilumatobacteraceae bacterium]|nr:extracellular polysaccharide biosynthesis protein [Ilumatobacteraceae bacterium]